MTSKAGHTFTAGPAKYDPESGDVVMADEVGARIASVDIENCADVNQADADGLLIAEAFTVAHETGLTPRQLAEQRAELVKALQWALAELDKSTSYAHPGQFLACDTRARAALSKATAGGVV